MENPSVKFKYIFEKDYNPSYANGAYGGISPKGEIVVNFYFERMPIPYDVVHAFNEDGTLGDVVRVLPENDDPKQRMFVRYVSSGIIMNLRTAKEVYTWLGDCIKGAEMEGNGNDLEDGDE